jgi:hypothetical protein
MDPKNQPQFNSKVPISEVLKQEQTGFVSSAPKLNDVVNAIGDMYDSTKNLGAANTIPKNPPVDTATTSNNTNPVQNATTTKIIKTYRSDAAEAVKMQQESVTKIAIAESEQRQRREEKIETTPKKKFWLLIMVIVLIVIGVAAIPTAQYLLNQKKQEVQVLKEKAIIPFDHQETLTLNNATRDDLVNAFYELQSKPKANSTIEYIKFIEKIQDVNNGSKTTTQEITPEIFASLIGPNIPSALSRSFDSDYMYGIEDSNNPKPFIIFKTSSYQQTFANMLRWETKIITDLSPIFNLSTDVLGRIFIDQVVINKDVRAITALDGTILFLYGFLDNQTLIITTNTQTFQDINNRYVAAHFVQ